MPDDIWEVSNPAGCTNNGQATDFSNLNVKETVDDRHYLRTYTWDADASEWTLTETGDDGGDSRVTVVREVAQATPPKRTVTRIVKSGGGTVVSQITTVYETPFGATSLKDPQKQAATKNEVVTSETRDTG